MPIPASQNCSLPSASSPVEGTIDMLWIAARLGRDGDSIDLTAATPPALEKILLANAVTGKLRLPHSFDNAAGDEAPAPFFPAGRPFRSVITVFVPRRKSISGIAILRVPACPAQPDNFMETLL